MTRVAILSVPTASGGVAYHAMAGDKQSHGKTAGEALDVLTAQLQDDEAGTIVIVQYHRPDTFFGESQQRRLADLMARWRAARDSGSELPAAEQAELDTLVEQELLAAQERTAALLGQLGR